MYFYRVAEIPFVNCDVINDLLVIINYLQPFRELTFLWLTFYNNFSQIENLQ